MTLQIDLLLPIHKNTFGSSTSSASKLLRRLGIDIVGIELSSIDAVKALVSTDIPISRSLAIVPRAVMSVENSRSLPTRSVVSTALPLYVPKNLSAARYLAKARGVCSVALTPDTLRFVDETQVNFMASSKHRKFVEVLLGDFLSLAPPTAEACGILSSKKISFERALFFMSKTIDRALTYDIGVVVSSGRKNLLHPIQMRALLKLLGYTRRERSLMTIVYPLELLQLWIQGERFVHR